MKTINLYFIWLFVLCLSVQLSAQTNEKELFLEGQKLFQKKEYKQATEIFSQILETQTKNPDYYLARAKSLYYSAKMQEAFNDYNMAVKLGNMVSLYYYERGLFLESIPTLASESIDNFTMAKNYAENDSMLFNSLYHRATVRGQIRDFDNAAEDFRNAYKINPGSIALLNNMAMYLNDVGKTDSAIVVLNKMIQIDSANVYAYQNMAFVLSGLEKFEESLKYFEKCFKMEKTPTSALYNNRGYVKFKLKEIDGAMADINKALKIDKTNSYAHRNRALIFIDKGKIKKACIDIDKALQLRYTQNYGNEVQELSNKYCK